jgi:putative transposase
VEIERYLKALAQEHKRWGFDKMMLKAKADSKHWNHKRVYRVYCHLGLNIRIKPRKRIPKGEAKMLMQPIYPNICWSADFMSDVLFCGSKFRTFNVIDDYNREGLLIAPGSALPAIRVTMLLDKIALTRGYPEVIRVDNGPEFRSEAFKNWAAKHKIMIHHIQPGKPAQNGFIERFNRTYREDVLDMNLFHNLNEVKEITAGWLRIYNNDRPHESLDGLAPLSFFEKRKGFLAIPKQRNSTFE